MPHPVRICLALHNHQPVGNFDNVFEQAYQDSYAPFLDVFEGYLDLKISLHTSGPLMEWLDQHHPEYLDRLAQLVRADRIEILGGAFYEPILTMIPSRDRVGQIRSFTQWLEQRLACQIQGMWTPERVWEQFLTKDLATAGIKYTILDDFHFRNAGLDPDHLGGYFLTEEEGATISVFPGSERLRYLIPFQEPHETISYLRQAGEQAPDKIFVFGDDGEKFGTWPDTKKHVYEHGWLRRFFDTLVENRSWLRTCTLGEAYGEVGPLGAIYIPEGSYREMTEWALPVDRQREYGNLSHDLEEDPRWKRIQTFVRGGYWRNFKIKYPETQEMYSRMMAVSHRVEEAEQNGLSAATVQAARRELYRGQCNCSYWHGAFGGCYLPHLRNAVYHHLIAADNILDEAQHREPHWVQARAEDLDFDLRKEVRLENGHLICLVSPHRGGQIYELDVRSIKHNLLATLNRREEVYHDKVRRGPPASQDAIASIHDRIVFKQEGLERRLHADRYPRKCLVDHCLPLSATLDQLAGDGVQEFGDFVQAAFDSRLLRNPDRIQLRMTRLGHFEDLPIQMTKGVTLDATGTGLEVAYMLEGIPPSRPVHFGVEFNFAGLPSALEDRYFFASDGTRLGDLGQRLDLADVLGLGLADEWLGIRLGLTVNRPTAIWAFPIQTVSQSEGGFELVHQSVTVLPHWLVQGDAEGRWSVTMKLDLDTSLAESRHSPSKPGHPTTETLVVAPFASSL